MKKLSFLLVLFVMLHSAAFSQEFGMGAVFDEKRYEQVPLSIPLIKGNYIEIPARYSLKDYTPTPGNQGQFGTCTAWATAYAARTILEAVGRNLTIKSEIDRLAFSPSYIYNQVTTDRSCFSGTYIEESLDTLKFQGVLPFKSFGYDCDKKVRPSDMRMARDYRIKDYKRLFDTRDNSKTLPVKRAIADKKPVVICMYWPQSMNDTARTKGVWRPYSSDASQLSKHGLHAITVIGYDDTKYGGAFEIINSWGTWWGNGGYLWVTYDDFNKFCTSAHEVIGYPARENYAQAEQLSGSLAFRELSGTVMASDLQGNLFEMKKSYPAETKFLAVIENNAPAYVYAIATDEKLQFSRMFPAREQLSPFFDKNSSFLFPGPTEENFVILEKTAGTEQIIFLFSRDELDLQNVLATMNRVSGRIEVKLKKALGEALIDFGQVKYGSGNRIQYAASTGNAYIVPVIVSITNSGSRESRFETDAPVFAVSEPRIDVLKLSDEASYSVPVIGKTKRLAGLVQDESKVVSFSVNGKEIDLQNGSEFDLEIEIPKLGENEYLLVAKDEHGNRAEKRLIIIRLL